MSIPPADLSKLRTLDLAQRPSKADAQNAAQPWQPGDSLKEFIDSLPKFLAADDLRAAAKAMAKASADGRPVILGMGAHPIKVGLSPLIIDAMERGLISALALNGAVVVHDVEMALVGRTSEDVAASLADGSFGMAKQTPAAVSLAIERFGEHGLGRAVGLALTEAPGAERSILAACARLDLPALVFVAMGTDIIHMHPGFDPAAMGAASHLDFRMLVSLVSGLSGGVYINLGSAVILPEVFLKALSAARNLSGEIKDFTTINMDMIAHYRPLTNVVQRPVLQGGQGINLIGHHEINLPLLLALALEL